MKDLSHQSQLRFEAPPFQPMMMCDQQPFEIAIFNEGMPSMTLPGEIEVYQILIQDEALEEGFPPDAQEAAELEDVERYNELQALLILMEERDEEARSGFTHIQRRWEVRRQEGLGKKKPMDVASDKLHAMNHSNRAHHVTSQALISRPHHSHFKMDHSQRIKSMKDPSMTMNKSMNNHTRMVLIQQPRKQN